MYKHLCGAYNTIYYKIHELSQNVQRESKTTCNWWKVIFHVFSPLIPHVQFSNFCSFYLVLALTLIFLDDFLSILALFIYFFSYAFCITSLGLLVCTMHIWMCIPFSLCCNVCWIIFHLLLLRFFVLLNSLFFFLLLSIRNAILFFA